ncbi:hypothetical protein KIW84_020295 [Lathyrus oleraceus]|uniref:Uncharacterized protein n=1 Tax=Pisum sativum TaxID=3888 RepID=A0A9D5B754_PEA|nr:hypothetical protein KIW84_020293 [Pisum sativum]KAI5432922.1 hypothetical protein KIW84_020295 [Pisum sativum]
MNKFGLPNPHQNSNLEANQFSGLVPAELGNLFNLQASVLSSNKLSGNLPVTFSQLQNLTDFRINDNSFNGKIPSFIQNWKQLQRLEMHASGLEGPIPSNISLLTNLSRLRISDINGPSQDFPILSNMTGMIRVVQRNCNITGEIPSYFWTMKDLDMLDLSFNNLFGEIPARAHVGHLRFLFLTGNKLSGNVPDSVLMDGSNVNLNLNMQNRETSPISGLPINLKGKRAFVTGVADDNGYGWAMGSLSLRYGLQM